MTYVYRLNDFLFHIGNYDFSLLSARPEKTLGYTTMLKPFDIYVWIFIGISVISVMSVMVIIEKSFDTWVKNSSRSYIHQCKYTGRHTIK